MGVDCRQVNKAFSTLNRMAPSPLTGEGRGKGENVKHTRTHHNAFTSPQPSPSRRKSNTRVLTHR